MTKLSQLEDAARKVAEKKQAEAADRSHAMAKKQAAAAEQLRVDSERVVPEIEADFVGKFGVTPDAIELTCVDTVRWDHDCGSHRWFETRGTLVCLGATITLALARTEGGHVSGSYYVPAGKGRQDRRYLRDAADLLALVEESKRRGIFARLLGH